MSITLEDILITLFTWMLVYKVKHIYTAVSIFFQWNVEIDNEFFFFNLHEKAILDIRFTSLLSSTLITFLQLYYPMGFPEFIKKL